MVQLKEWVVAKLSRGSNLSRLVFIGGLLNEVGIVADRLTEGNLLGK
jgi:hypothetical protein